jgi:transcriptional regulator with GAF, ATPase, and Fis domain
LDRAALSVRPGTYSFGPETPEPVEPAGTNTKSDASPVGERERIIQALERCGGNQTHAARLLGVSRRTLISRIERHALPRPRKRDTE